MRAHQVVIVMGDTGCGKSTQIPKICLAAGLGNKGIIGCCQPRRIAAVSIAKRVGTEFGPLGQKLVGFKIRFSHRLCPKTRIKFMTDGILIAESQKDPMLRAYDAIILDEAHERSINIDLIAGILKRIFDKRRDLRVIVTSATMEVEKFQRFFNNPPLFKINGRTFPVKIVYERESWYENPKDIGISEKVKSVCEMIRKTDPFGHILAFLPTERHIFETANLLKKDMRDECLILPLFARLPAHKQALIFKPSAKQKIILATNIAETSITVPSIRYVIDSGLARISVYNINTHTRALPVSKIAKANCEQRAGRAGRVQKGLCIRLFSEEDFLLRENFTPPEIQRCNLAEVILRILHQKLGPVDKFPFIDPPKPAAIKEGLHTLFELGAVDKDGKLTDLGHKMARLALDPRLSRILFQALKENCLGEALVIVAALSVQDIWVTVQTESSDAKTKAKRLQDDSSDFLTYLNVWEEIAIFEKKGLSKKGLRDFCKEHMLSYTKILEWKDVFSQISRMLINQKIAKEEHIKLHSSCKKIKKNEQLQDAIHRSILSGFLGHAACKKIKGHGYKGSKGKEIFIFPGSSLFKNGPKWIVSAEQVKTSRLFARTVAPIRPIWIEQLGNHLCKYSYFEPKWDRNRGEATIFEKVNFYGMTLFPSRKRSLASFDPELAQRIFLEQGLAICELKYQYAFNDHNISVLEELKEAGQKNRSGTIPIDQEILIQFFKRAITKLEKSTGTRILREDDLRKIIKTHPELEKELFIEKEELLKELLPRDMDELYPGHLEVNGQTLPLLYRFNPNKKDDGIVVRVPVILIPHLHERDFEWLVPGFLIEKVVYLLKQLPKKIRKGLEPLDEVAKVFCQSSSVVRKGLRKDLAQFLCKKFGCQVETEFLERAFPKERQLPIHLRMGFEIVGKDGSCYGFDKDLSCLQKAFLQQGQKELTRWMKYQYQKKKLGRSIDADDLSSIPPKVEIGYWADILIYGFVGIVDEKGVPATRLFLSESTAINDSQEGLFLLMETFLKKETKYIKKLIHQEVQEIFLRLLQNRTLYTEIYKKEVSCLKERIYRHLKLAYFPRWQQIPDSKEFKKQAATLKKTFIPNALSLLTLIRPALCEYVLLRLSEQGLMRRVGNIEASRNTLDTTRRINKALMDLLLGVSPSEYFLKNVPRYLRALRIRLERAEYELNRDRTKWNKFEPYFHQFLKVFEYAKKSDPFFCQDKGYHEFQEQIFELMVSIFAPELSIRGRLSHKKMSFFLSKNQKGL